MTLLDNIQSPKDLKQLKVKQLSQLCKELRQFIIEETSKNPGHLGANLGVIELTVALHYVFDTPEDKLIWDVGHQAYAHKILTGRRDDFHTNRKYKGLSGFPRRDESEYDAFGVGHASTSISAALGMATADALAGKKNKHIAVVGDGSLTGGLSFEGLNNAGAHQKTDLLIILNDNNMAIDPNVGALKKYLIQIVSSKEYNQLKKDTWRLLGFLKFPQMQLLLQRVMRSTKQFFMRNSNLFESLGIRYFGHVNGHDVKALVEMLQRLQQMKEPRLLHVITAKGKGIKSATNNQTVWHAPGRFDKDTEQLIKEQTDDIPRFQDVFGETLVELARENDKIVAITPAMPTGCSMNNMFKAFPERTFDVGIAEEHAVTFSAGLAAQGMIPFCNIYSSFMQRAYDQVIHDVALQKLPVIFCLDKGGLVGEDGATHHGFFDLVYMRAIPHMIISAPMDEIELRKLMFTAQTTTLPFSIRYPRGKGEYADWRVPFNALEVGKGRKLSEGKDIAVISIGTIGRNVQKAIQLVQEKGVSVTHCDMRFLKPIDEGLLHEVFKLFDKVITVEDGIITGGLGSAVTEFAADNNYKASIIRCGIPDYFVEHGTILELHKECGIDVESLAAIILS